MQLLITDTVIVTNDDERRILDRAAIAIDGDRIAAIGASDVLKRDYATFPTLDARGKAVLPGLINGHNHAVLTIARGTVEDWEGDSIYGYMAPLSFVMEPEERAVMATLGAVEAIRSGTTMMVEQFRWVPGYAKALVDTGLRLVLSEICTDVNTTRVRFGDYTPDHQWGGAFLERTEELIATWHGARNGRVEVQVGAQGSDNCSPWILGKLMDIAKRKGLKRNVHLSQSTSEVKRIREAYGQTSTEYLDAQGWLDADLSAAHWTFCTEADVELLAERGVTMSHCPANSSRRGIHKVLAERIEKAGVNIALGTDNMTEDLFHTMKIALILYRGASGGGIHPTPQEIFDRLTRNNAIALGKLRDIASLEKGKKADLVLIDLNRANLRPIISLMSNLVHYGHPGIVDSVMVDGAWLMREGRVTTIDEAALAREAQDVTKRVWERLLERNPDIARPKGLRWLDA